MNARQAAAISFPPSVPMNSSSEEIVRIGGGRYRVQTWDGRQWLSVPAKERPPNAHRIGLVWVLIEPASE